MTKKIFHKTKLMLLLIGCFILITSVNSVHAQTITGTVLSTTDNQPLDGVTVQLKGSTRATTTDKAGHYSLSDVSANDSLTFSFVGFHPQTISSNGRSRINVSLEATASSLDQVVVVGYGTQKKSDLTGSIARIDAKTFENQPMTQITDMLTGTVAGVNISQGTSASGRSFIY